jgi:hypothetical protein
MRHLEVLLPSSMLGDDMWAEWNLLQMIAPNAFCFRHFGTKNSSVASKILVRYATSQNETIIISPTQVDIPQSGVQYAASTSGSV